jgi:hypothetical protein
MKTKSARPRMAAGAIQNNFFFPRVISFPHLSKLGLGKS